MAIYWLKAGFFIVGQAGTSSTKNSLKLALGIDSLGIQSLTALATQQVWLRAKAP